VAVVAKQAKAALSNRGTGQDKGTGVRAVVARKVAVVVVVAVVVGAVGTIRVVVVVVE
jgi:hypothetical protein